MRQLFFYVLAGSLVAAVAAWALYMLGRAITELFGDWKLGRELDQLEAESAARRKQRQEALEMRLASGCEHDFTSGAIGLPPNVCSKCGLEKEKPAGLCDHVWRVKEGPIPYSQCELCDKIYRPTPHSSDTTHQ